jgi:hypothetical protein
MRLVVPGLSICQVFASAIESETPEGFIEIPSAVLVPYAPDIENSERMRDTVKWAFKKGISSAMKGLSLVVISFATVAGVAAVATEHALRSPRSWDSANTATDAMLLRSLPSKISARAFHHPLNTLHRLSRGLYLTAESLERGTMEQLSDLTRISHMTGANPTALVAALESRIAERAARGYHSDLLEERVYFYRQRMRDTSRGFLLAIPGFDEYV